jgi:hypothetical protein
VKSFEVSTFLSFGKITPDESPNFTRSPFLVAWYVFSAEDRKVGSSRMFSWERKEQFISNSREMMR